MNRLSKDMSSIDQETGESEFMFCISDAGNMLIEFISLYVLCQLMSLGCNRLGCRDCINSW